MPKRKREKKKRRKYQYKKPKVVEHCGRETRKGIQGGSIRSLHAIYESFQAGAVLGRDEVGTANVGPTYAVRPIVPLLDFQ